MRADALSPFPDFQGERTFARRLDYISTLLMFYAHFYKHYPIS